MDLSEVKDDIGPEKILEVYDPSTGMRGFTVIDNGSTVRESPLKQLKSGIEPKDVVCKIGLELVMKKSNGEPICIKGTSVKSLTLRGYIPEYNGVLGGETPSDEIVIDCQSLDPTDDCSIHVIPKSFEIYINPPTLTTAANFIPFAVDTIATHSLDPADTCSVQLIPEFIEV